MTFNPLSDPIDYITLAGQRSPGIATVSGAMSARDIQERKGYGLGGAYAVYKGIKLASPKVTIQLTTQEDWDNWHAWRPLVDRPPTGRRARALDIWHPILEDIGITSVLVKQVGQPDQTDTGEWTIVIDFTEYRRPVRALATPDGSDTEQLTPGELQILALQSAVENQRNRNQQRGALVL